MKKNIIPTVFIFFAIFILSCLNSDAASPAMNQLAAFAKDSFDKIEISFYEYFNFGDFEAWQGAFFLAGILFAVVFARTISWVINKRIQIISENEKHQIQVLLLMALEAPIRLTIFSIGLYVSAIPLFVMFSDQVRVYFGRLCLAMAAISASCIIYKLTSVIEHLLLRFSHRNSNNIDDMVISAARRTLRVLIVIFSITFIGQNILKMNITALLAGASVAGLAIAFAAQDSIANFFGSMMIIMDRPFKIGDRVKIASTDGIIETIGFRSTKIRTLDGHLVSIPNKKLAESEIENISQRPHIKKTTNLTVTYDTKPEKMERAIEILHEIFDNHEGYDKNFPPKIFFSSFNDWSLNIMVVSWYHSNDFWKFQEWNHRNNIEILKRFNAEGIEFAFPTNTTYLAGDSKRQLEISIKGQKSSPS